MKTVVILLASGTSSRLGLSIPKQYQLIGDSYLLELSLRQFEDHRLVDEILLVVSKDHVNQVKNKLNDSYKKVVDIIEGGGERYESVYNGIKYYNKNIIKQDDVKVLIHDSARALVSADIISRNIEKLDDYRAVSTVFPLYDTIILGDDERIKKTVKRNDYRVCQTPQGFYLNDIVLAYDYFIKQNVEATDDTFIYHLFFPNDEIGSVLGEENNFKVTTQNHLKLLKFIINSNN